jgi:hypothetical protein
VRNIIFALLILAGCAAQSQSVQDRPSVCDNVPRYVSHREVFVGNHLVLFVTMNASCGKDCEFVVVVTPVSVPGGGYEFEFLDKISCVQADVFIHNNEIVNRKFSADLKEGGLHESSSLHHSSERGKVCR